MQKARSFMQEGKNQEPSCFVTGKAEHSWLYDGQSGWFSMISLFLHIFYCRPLSHFLWSSAYTSPFFWMERLDPSKILSEKPPAHPGHSFSTRSGWWAGMLADHLRVAAELTKGCLSSNAWCGHNCYNSKKSQITSEYRDECHLLASLNQFHTSNGSNEFLVFDVRATRRWLLDKRP